MWGRKIYQAKGMRLGMLIDRGVVEFLYTYDFGDDWRHRITVESVGVADTQVDYPNRRFLESRFAYRIQELAYGAEQARLARGLDEVQRD